MEFVMPYKDPNKQREYQRKYIANRKTLFYKDKRCEECGKKDDLEPDHIVPRSISGRKKITYSWAPSRLEIEVAKHCRILCHACHVKRHAEEMRTELVHGTDAGYKKGCKCKRCRYAHSERIRNYRLKKKFESAQVA